MSTYPVIPRSNEHQRRRYFLLLVSRHIRKASFSDRVSNMAPRRMCKDIIFYEDDSLKRKFFIINDVNYTMTQLSQSSPEILDETRDDNIIIL